MKRKSKLNCEKIHFKRRMLERENMLISNDEYDIIRSRIGSGKAKLIQVESNTRKHYIIPYNGKELYVVYDNLRHSLITVLPKGDNHVVKCS